MSPAGTRGKERESASHLNSSSSNRTSSQNQSSSGNRRSEGRETQKKRQGETGDDWRRSTSLFTLIAVADEFPDETSRNSRDGEFY